MESTLNLNDNNQIEITGNVTYNDIVHIVYCIKNRLVKRFRKIDDIVKHKELVEKYLPLLQNNKEPFLDISTRSSKDRYVIYKLCDILSLECERIEEHKIREFRCDEFEGSDWDDYNPECGCGNVPKKWEKYECDLDYDDLYMIYKIPWCYKLGVRIIFDHNNTEFIQ